MIGLRARPAIYGICCLAFVATNALGREFRILEAQSETKLGRTERFVASDAFKAGKKIGGRTLSGVGFNFVEHFFGVVEPNTSEITLKGWTLRYTASDKLLIDTFGGEKNVTLPFLACVYSLMDMGDIGPSHVDGRSNFAYVRSPIDRKLWAVHWTVNHANEWTIGAVFVPHPDIDWRSASRLFGGTADPTNTADAGREIR